jgi:hypothetical protein
MTIGMSRWESMGGVGIHMSEVQGVGSIFEGSPEERQCTKPKKGAVFSCAHSLSPKRLLPMHSAFKPIALCNPLEGATHVSMYKRCVISVCAASVCMPWLARNPVS